MPWRDDIAAYAENADVAGVLSIFDALWADREKVWQLSNAYLGHITELKGGKPPTDECLKLQRELSGLLKKVKL